VRIVGLGVRTEQWGRSAPPETAAFEGHLRRSSRANPAILTATGICPSGSGNRQHCHEHE
jgi:hypothetical protein